MFMGDKDKVYYLPPVSSDAEVESDESVEEPEERGVLVQFADASVQAAFKELGADLDARSRPSSLGGSGDDPWLIADGQLDPGSERSGPKALVFPVSRIVPVAFEPLEESVEQVPRSGVTLARPLEALLGLIRAWKNRR